MGSRGLDPLQGGLRGPGASWSGKEGRAAPFFLLYVHVGRYFSR